MIPTIDYVSRKFDEFNRLCFNGELRPLPFRLSNARSFLGQVRFVRKRSLTGEWIYSDFVFCISRKIDLPQDVVDDTILHEMIHYYILSNRLRDTAPHGKIFTSMMRDINRRFGRNISVRYRVTKEYRDNDTELRQHFVCALRLRDGREGVLVAARSRIFMLWDRVAASGAVAEWKWYSSLDPFFNRYPRSLTFKFYPLSHSLLTPHLSDAMPLRREGSLIRIEKTSAS